MPYYYRATKYEQIMKSLYFIMRIYCPQVTAITNPKIIRSYCRKNIANKYFMYYYSVIIVNEIFNFHQTNTNTFIEYRTEYLILRDCYLHCGCAKIKLFTVSYVASVRHQQPSYDITAEEKRCVMQGNVEYYIHFRFNAE